MRIVEILLEYNREITARKYGAKMLSRAEGEFSSNLSTSTELLNSIFDSIESQDPTPNKEYSVWLAKLYALSDLNIDDIDSKLLLAHFRGKQKRALDTRHNDINRFTSYAEFANTIKQYNIDELLLNEKETRTVVHQDSQVTIIVPHTESAACKYGANTTWCTAATRSINQFSEYNEQGPLYILIPRQPRYSTEKYQLHWETSQFVNELDRPVDINIIFNRLPTALKFFRKIKDQNTSMVKHIVLYSDQELWDQIKSNPSILSYFNDHDVLERSSLLLAGIKELDISKPLVGIINKIKEIRRTDFIDDPTIEQLDTDIDFVINSLEVAIIETDPNKIFHLRFPSFDVANIAISRGQNRTAVRHHQLSCLAAERDMRNISPSVLLDRMIHNSLVMAKENQQDLQRIVKESQQLRESIIGLKPFIAAQPKIAEHIKNMISDAEKRIAYLRNIQKESIFWYKYHKQQLIGYKEIAKDLR